MISMLRTALLSALILVLQQPVAAQSFSYLALGDSYTIGEKVDEQSRWPVMLADTLTKLGYSVSDPQIVAVTGWITSELQARIEDTNLQQNYDLVSLLIGVNNQYRGQDIEVFRKEFSQLLQQAIDFVGGQPNHVLELSTPDYGIIPFAENKNPAKITREINRYNQIKESIAKKHGVHFVNIIPISRKAESNQTLLAEDQLHPSGKMYRMWVDKLLPVVTIEIKTMDSQNQ